jgi:hypothetical protein
MTRPDRGNGRGQNIAYSIPDIMSGIEYSIMQL